MRGLPSLPLARLRASLAAVLAPPDYPELRAVHAWLDSWSGIGLVAAGMARQGWDLELKRFAEHGWHAMFYAAGETHTMGSYFGSGWSKEPWRAVQRAAWDAFRREDDAKPKATSAGARA